MKVPKSQTIPPLAIDKEFNEETLSQLSDKPKEYQAQMLDARARTLERYSKKLYTELGMIGLYMEETQLWKLVIIPSIDEFGNQVFGPAKSFEGWVNDACPYSRSYLFEAKTRMKILRDGGASMKEIEEVPRCNIVTLAKLSTKLMQDPEIIDAAKHLTEEEFTKKIQTDHPGQHLEQKRTMIFHPEVSGKVTVDSAIAKAMKIWDCTRDEALVYISETFNEYCDKEEAKAMAAANA